MHTFLTIVVGKFAQDLPNKETANVCKLDSKYGNVSISYRFLE